MIAVMALRFLFYPPYVLSSRPWRYGWQRWLISHFGNMLLYGRWYQLGFAYWPYNRSRRISSPLITNIGMVPRVFKTIFTVLFLLGAVCTMLFLGNWQLQRLEWKTTILADIAKQESTDAMATALDLSNTDEFQRGFIDGEYMQVKPIRLAPRTNDGKVGYHFIQPFKTNNDNIILVNMGWVSNDTKSVTFNTKPKRIAGYLKTPDSKGSFTPNNNPDQNLWYFIDINDVRDRLGGDVHPQMLYLESPEKAIPKPFSGLPKPRNNHAQYAAFWFGMAGLLVFLSGLLIFRRKP